MNEIQTFNFKNSGVRTFVDETGKPWFCAKDVCDILGYKKSRNAIARHTKPEGALKRGLVETLSNGRQQEFETTFIDERNVYRLVLRSELPEAETFQDWVCGEVLPTIRKTGSYGKPQVPALPSYSEALRQLADELDKNKELENKKRSLECKIKADEHKVDFYDECCSTADLYLGTEVASRLKLKRPFFFNWCRNRGIIQRHNNRWMSTAKYRAKKWCFDVVKPFTGKDGEMRDSGQLYFSLLGMRGIYDLMHEENVPGLPQQLDLTLVGESK